MEDEGRKGKRDLGMGHGYHDGYGCRYLYGE